MLNRFCQRILVDTDVHPVTMDGMEWRDAPGFPGYQVSGDGRIRRSVPVRGGIAGKVLRPFAKESGHRDIVLRRNGKFVHARIARLVCEAWHGPCPAGHECCHNDGDPANDHWTNLRWDTRKANHADKLSHGTDFRGERSPNARLTWKKVREIRGRYAAGGVTMLQLAKEYGVIETAIWKIINQKRWVETPNQLA